MLTRRPDAIGHGVLAIIITVMVLGLKVPMGDQLSDLWHDTGVDLLTYALSFVLIDICWNSHHSLLESLAMKIWLNTQATPLTPHPDDPLIAGSSRGQSA
jgi:uncharacterized membrane protein